MKYTAILLVLIVILIVVITAYAWMNTALVCKATGVQVNAAESRMDEFARIETAFENNAVQGTAYQESLAGGATNYDFMTFNIKIANKGLLDAEMVEIQIKPVDGDVACFSGYGGVDRNTPVAVKALSTENILCTLITHAGNHAVREFIITYYIWGRPYSVACTFG